MLLSAKKCEQGSDSSNPSQEEVTATSDSSAAIRSGSTLPTPAPNSQPPTPTRLSSSLKNAFVWGEWKEERGDIIMFYNQVYVPAMKDYIMKFTTNVSELI